MLKLGRTIAVGAIGLGVAATSCTGGGGQELRTDGDAPPVEFEAAVSETFAGTGRYTFTMDDDDAEDVTRTGEFAGDDIIGTEKWEDEDPTTTLIVDDVAYEKIGPDTEDYWGVDASVLAGKEWIRTTPTPEEMADMDIPDGVDPEVAAAMMNADSMGGGDASAPQILSQLDRILSRAETVTADGTVQAGDRTYDRYRITLGGDQLFELYGVDPATGLLSSILMFGDNSTPEDLRRRAETIVDYMHDHTKLELTVLAEGGQVGRVDIRFSSTVEDEYGDCMFLDVESAGGGTMSFEFTDLGAPITIAAPNPATVVSMGEIEDAYSFDDGELDTDFGTSTSDEPRISTSDGEWTRDELEEWVIWDADELGVDPVTVPALPEDQLVALYEKTLTLGGPMLETEMDGEMPRSDIVATVIAGADRIGLDPAAVPAMSDADLVDAYDRIMGIRYGSDGGGDEMFGDMLEGCPGA